MLALQFLETLISQEPKIIEDLSPVKEIPQTIKDKSSED